MHIQQPRWTQRIEGGVLPERERIGGKAWSLARMGALGLPVPPAFVVTTDACVAYMQSDRMPEGLEDEIDAGIRWLEAASGRSFGDGDKPLLLSIRSGAAISMPGMMDTVLNLGIDSATEQALAAECGDLRFARDTHRRFHEMYARVVLKATIPDLDADGGPDAWRDVITGSGAGTMPADIREQLMSSVRAVFDSWQSRRARRYRRHHDIPDEMGTAVTLQAMVFGNLDDNSGTGVLFSRNPINGKAEPYGEYLRRAQGEDVVSGRFTPKNLDDLKAQAPQAHAQLLEAAAKLEAVNRDMQDIEFTVQHGQLYLLQSRAAKRAPAAAVRVAVAMQAEGLINIDEALSRISAQQLRSVLSPRLAPGATESAERLLTGEAASPGIGTGTVVEDSDEAERRAAAGEAVVLARPSTSPDDLHGMLVARAVITDTGGSTSHAAVVGRALGLPCVVGCGDGSTQSLKGLVVTVDGSEGRVYRGELSVYTPDETGEANLAQLLDWARQRSPLRVLAPEAVPSEAQVIDLDSIEGGADPARISAVLRTAAANADGARGGTIAGDEGVAAALAAGLDFIVASPSLPPLLAALHARARAASESRDTANEALS